MSNELSSKIDDLKERLTELRGIFDLPQKQARLEELDAISQDPSFWDDSDRAQELMKERGEIEGLLEKFDAQQTNVEEARVFIELSEEVGGDEDSLAEARNLLQQTEREVESLETRRMLGGEHDDHNAIFSINSGAGGTESQDWADMLLRMYLRYMEKKGWKAEITDKQDGEEAGIKGADILVKGEYAYGMLKAEAGVHRLVRISPFDSSSRRHTSFAAVSVAPEIDDDIEIEINDSDLRIDTYRASGAGGQHVNRTDSAVRITHQPTGIVVQCQNERSQHKNRATAMKILRAKLYEKELREREERAAAEHSEQKDVAFGSQIRSYVLHPYKQVKDLRTGVTIGNTDSVLDGDLDEFIEAYLLQQGGETEEEPAEAS
ncbi:peptide chain release factor 2 [Persicimonas caeni]|uniref:Peptide chain release factor 2 n=1 Tax=Persicimonas caeni TaxID=2292766 RepID=A0A4Y6Q179_PERCE|nr:peptide chain release factor 2 [Persicimonas caeni]QDG54334.1 peptide chain release factor 2 [Persicimonas caeni]QED35555.1 peptide chain release factor 2 [Persicimonas caeni]